MKQTIHDQIASLRRRIAAARQSRKSHAHLEARLITTRLRQLRLELRADKQSQSAGDKGGRTSVLDQGGAAPGMGVPTPSDTAADLRLGASDR